MPEPTAGILSLAFGAANPKDKTPIELAADDKDDGAGGKSDPKATGVEKFPSIHTAAKALDAAQRGKGRR